MAKATNSMLKTLVFIKTTNVTCNKVFSHKLGTCSASNSYLQPDCNPYGATWKCWLGLEQSPIPCPCKVFHNQKSRRVLRAFVCVYPILSLNVRMSDPLNRLVVLHHQNLHQHIHANPNYVSGTVFNAKWELIQRNFTTSVMSMV